MFPRPVDRFVSGFCTFGLMILVLSGIPEFGFGLCGWPRTACLSCISKWQSTVSIRYVARSKEHIISDYWEVGIVYIIPV